MVGVDRDAEPGIGWKRSPSPPSRCRQSVARRRWAFSLVPVWYSVKHCVHIPGSLGHECDAYMSAFISFGFESKTTVHAAPASGWYHVWCGGCSGTAVESLLSHVGQDALRSLVVLNEVLLPGALLGCMKTGSSHKPLPVASVMLGSSTICWHGSNVHFHRYPEGVFVGHRPPGTSVAPCSQKKFYIYTLQMVHTHTNKQTNTRLKHI